ncbi:leucyl/phenylalanyl-tRNA--protein transferase [Aquimarina aggregata]|uniref:Leucyl/phenylalanyl-tRNA--protein transferase n=1 Tax=Aquimarina aggregata TaxID=1642818 RepID=A0A162ZM99_9FLAO|nr:leucyl/phenylalanyl-tRNA--protein transferase [Aquimarina aggregata]KZS39903.1 leucyl/phenylalanyl-tRNA--protein transferase [Aquimarina aggregata]
MYILTNTLQFPSVNHADIDGLLAVGGDLSTDRLVEAYTNGIFPWYNEDQPILWFSPDPRMVLFPKELHISKSMKQLLRKDQFEVTFNKDFDTVIYNCATVKRVEQDGTWITNDMQKAYKKMHILGYAISVEVWFDSELVGGLYGIWLADKKIFCGESMFSKVNNASKFGFIKLVEWLKQKEVNLIDCQVYTDHLASLGAREISRAEFLTFLK